MHFMDYFKNVINETLSVQLLNYLQLMKTQYFRVKKTLDRPQQKYTPKRQQQEPPKLQSSTEISQLINLLQAFIKQKGESQANLQPRDKHPIIQYLNNNRHSISDRELQIWITDVCRTTFSTAFNYYYTDQLSYEQARIFCAETIIKNIVRLTEKTKLSATKIKILDQYIQNKILPYMLKKYPLTGQSDVNKALENAVQEVNSLSELQNDFIYITKIKFSYRKSGNYNDLIMSVLNKVLRMIDQSSKKSSDNTKDQLSNYKDFELTMSTIFQKVEDLNWMNKRNNDSQEKQNIRRQLNMTLAQSINEDQKQIEKYRQQVKAYTTFLIGRKVSENIDLFTDNQISNEHLVVKHSSILRILTKWCEELQGKFTKSNYMQENLESIQTLGGDINSLNDQHRQNLDEKLQNQMIQIREYLQRLRESFFFEQSSELLRHLQTDDYNFIEPYEKAFGKFSCQMVKNLHTYIIKYLNRLIHGLVKVSYDWHRQSGYRNNYEKWSYPPNLVTFKVGDLIRCKCSSKEKQILSIFNQLNRISTKNPQKMKIIRIKDRLRTQTNDILINVKFNNCLIGQIQLAVNTKKSKFAQYSNNFNHYLYQIQRCIFGPFSELANIWRNIDIRSRQFQDIIRSEGRAQVGIQEIRRTEISIGCNVDSSTGHDYINYDLPFRCTYCKNYHSHNDVIISNIHCQQCKTFKCMRCQVESMNPEQLKMKIFGKKYDQLGKKVQMATSQFPSYGCFVQTDSRTPKVTFFKEYKINGILYYLGKRNGRIYRVVKTDQKSIKNFFYHNIVFKLKEQTNQFVKMTNSQVKQSYILPQYVQNIYRSQKQVIFLSQKKIRSDKWPSILSNTKFKESLLNIKKIEISNNDITDLQFIPGIFPNLESIGFQRNQGCKIDPLTKLAKLKAINSQNNNITSIPSSINQLKCLQQLNIYKNNVGFLPRQVFQIKNLKILNIKYNQITQLPQQLGNLQNLNELLLRGNNLKYIPDCIEKLSNLTILNVGKCSLKLLNPKLGSLKKLKILDLATNQLDQIPSSFSNLISLEKLKIQDNKLTEVPDFVSNFVNLVEFTLYSNRIQAITLNFAKLQKLVTLNISNNLISRIDKSITSLNMLTQFYLHSNKYQNHFILAQLTDIQNLSLDIPTKEGSYSCVPKEICSLNNLLTLKLRTTENRLTLTPAIRNLNQLQSLDLANNGLIEIPKDIILLSSLQKLSLQDNLIQKFPVQFLNSLTKLQEINLKNNRFKRVQKELIDKLKVINFSNNQIADIQIPNYKNKTLKKLILRQNTLTKVPKNISWLKKLKQLDISFNKITTLEQNLIELRNMQYLSFHIYGNPIKHINCGNFIESQMCEQSKAFINDLVGELILQQFNTSQL